MAYSHDTMYGIMHSGGEYRDTLIKEGYTDMGWQNGWDLNKELLWMQQKALEHNQVEHYQWNRSGSDCTYVLHGNKVFCSVDMGD